MVGRGLRLHPDKDKLILIDCVGITGKANLCTAPSLLGIDMSEVPKNQRNKIQGDLFDLPDKVTLSMDTPESWIRNTEIIDLWANEQEYNLHNINFFKMPDGSLTLSLPERVITIPCQDHLGNVKGMPFQEAIDKVYAYLLKNHVDSRAIWDRNAVKRWGNDPATDKQKNIISKRFADFDCTDLTKIQASQILNRIFSMKGK